MPIVNSPGYFFIQDSIKIWVFFFTSGNILTKVIFKCSEIKRLNRVGRVSEAASALCPLPREYRIPPPSTERRPLRGSGVKVTKKKRTRMYSFL